MLAAESPEAKYEHPLERTLLVFALTIAVVTCGGGGPPASNPTEAVATLRLEVDSGTGTGIYEAGETVTIRAGSVNDRYFFSHWSSEQGGTFADPNDPETVFTMPSVPLVQITANYIPIVGPDIQVSAARRWSEVLLQAIRNDFARPTVHARNLFHISSAMYDAWAAYSTTEQPWLLGRTRAGLDCDSPPLPASVDIESDRIQALSHAAYRMIRHRFAESPGSQQIMKDADSMLSFLGFDRNDTSVDVTTGPAALGNHIAQCYIDFGLVDGSNEANSYINRHYIPVNERLRPELPGNPEITDMDRWQEVRITVRDSPCAGVLANA